MKKLYYKFAFVLSIIILPADHIYTQIIIDCNTTPEQMVENLIGVGITFSNISYETAPSAGGIFTSGLSAGIQVNEGVFLCTGDGDNIPGPNNDPGASYNNGYPGNELITGLTGTITYDAAVLEFDFIAQYDNLFYNYVLGSEEYNEYVYTFNDGFGIFITGPNPDGEYFNNHNFAVIEVDTTLIPVSIANINNGYSAAGTPSTGPCTNCQFYIDNYDGANNLQYDGITTRIITEVPIYSDSTYHLIFAIADATDYLFDSGVFIEKGSVESLGPPMFDTFVFKAENNESLDIDVIGEITGNQVFLTVPDGTDRSNLVADFVIGGVHVNVKEMNQISGVTENDFRDIVNYDLNGYDTLQWEVIVRTVTLSTEIYFSDVRIGPNPNNGNLEIKNAQRINITLFNNSGTEIYKLYDSDINTITVNDLVSGMYFIHLEKAGVIEVRKVVVY